MMSFTYHPKKRWTI